MRLSLGSVTVKLSCHRDRVCSALLDHAKLFSKVVTPFHTPASVMGALGLRSLIILDTV